MRTRFIVASSIGLLGITSMVVWATTFADTTGTIKMGGYGLGTKISKNNEWIIENLENTWDEAAFNATIEQALHDGNFSTFVAAHVKHGSIMNITQDQFNEMIAIKSEMDAFNKKVHEALKNGDYTTWKALNKDTPLLSKINTEAKFKELQSIDIEKL